MCRISLLTATDVPQYSAALLLHDLMLRSNADSQPDGWGIYLDGCGIQHKSAAPYWQGSSQWMHDYMDQSTPDGYNNGVMLGHVRTASAYTGRADKDSHPFTFLNDDGSVRFVAAHNGQINGSYVPYVYDASAPNVDSYRAFLKLSEMLGADGTIDASLIDAWLAHYECGSAFVITLIRNGTLYVLRNDKRPLHFANIGNGFVFNTSLMILEASRDYAKRVLGLDMTDPKGMRHNMLFEIPIGEHDVSASELTLPMIAPQHERNRSVYRTQTTTAQTQPLVHVPEATTDSDAADVWESENTATNATDPWWRVDTNVRPTKLADATWNEIRALLNPCRSGLASLYAVMYTHMDMIDDDIMDVYGRAKFDPNWQSLTQSQLEEFRDYIQTKPLTSEQRHVINQWNRQVESTMEVDEQVYAFGATLFFHLPLTFVGEYLKETVERTIVESM